MQAQICDHLTSTYHLDSQSVTPKCHLLVTVDLHNLQNEYSLFQMSFYSIAYQKNEWRYHVQRFYQRCHIDKNTLPLKTVFLALLLFLINKVIILSLQFGKHAYIP